MPRILIYEFLAAGGRLDGDAVASESLRREGAAMLRAIAADFAAIDGVEATVLLDSQWHGPPPAGCRVVPVREPADDCRMLAAESARADWTVVIAPEFDGLLEARCELVESAGGRLLGPSSQLVALAADKQRTAEFLAAAGVPVAKGIATSPDKPLPADFAFGYPAVFKPRDGAGSQDVWLIPHRAVAERVRGELGRPGRLERFYPGLAASVAVLCGPAGRWPLLPCRQRLSGDGRFHYLGGSCPLESQLAERAAALALRAIEALPKPLGYLGVDLGPGPDEGGGEDVVIEINPRLTTSYVGLRAAVTENLARAMLEAALGRACHCFLERPNGRIRRRWCGARFARRAALRLIESSMETARGETASGGYSFVRHLALDIRHFTMDWLALDIGGANVKVADGRDFAASYPFPLWQQSRKLAELLRTVIAESPPADHLAATMTGELCDCFATKAEGVRFIIDALVTASDGRHARIYQTNGMLVSPQVAARSPLLVAAANWHALARFAGTFAPQGTGLLIDIGSTTCDIIPLMDGRPVADGATDPERLLSGELVYTGVERSPVCALVSTLPWRKRQCPVAQEVFATSWDAYLTLGDLPEEPTSTHTADRRPATKEAARDRLARSICADRDMFDETDAENAAEAIARSQTAQIAVAYSQVAGRLPAPPAVIVISGRGEFLVRRVLERLQVDAKIVSLSDELGPDLSRSATAHALALLARTGDE